MKLSVLNQPVQDQKETKESHWATEPIPSQNTSTSSIQDEDALLSMQEAADPSDVVNIRDGDTLPKSLRVALSQELLDQISSRMHDADHGQLDSVDMLELLLAFDQLRAQKYVWLQDAWQSMHELTMPHRQERGQHPQGLAGGPDYLPAKLQVRSVHQAPRHVQKESRSELDGSRAFLPPDRRVERRLRAAVGAPWLCVRRASIPLRPPPRDSEIPA
eukprot:scaffold1449_cov244-Pinguiococcus_pyrenoidosus.AAC.16